MNVVVLGVDRIATYESLGAVPVREDEDCPYPMNGAINVPLPFPEEE